MRSSSQSSLATSQQLADAIRLRIIEMSASPAGVHVGGSISIADIMGVLYAEILRNPAGGWSDHDRDHFILSKGHACSALYAALVEIGALDARALDSYAEDDGILAGHPMKGISGVDFSTGALGHGLPIGVGIALGGLRLGTRRRAFVILGDGELQEGSNWEAAMAAPALGLHNLVAIVDRNRWQISGATEDCVGLEPLSSKWSSFGWETAVIDGHDHAQIRDALTAPRERPLAVVAETIKARGVPGLEDTKDSHSASLDDQERAAALRAMGRLTS
ncbi:transketolase [Gordonia soli]|uniref:Putative transketolase N-terminal section n=1 Tax=Gordonia soli NBRC 108243 TaxID=1223545 RepID=M0QGM9_9ACTN|nr:transketolase [Gordonia soli]GAC67441.1 putative transketolase N-terminal section [Gordonia soli NBRC 108243]